jgi:hypothetical protein
MPTHLGHEWAATEPRGPPRTLSASVAGGTRPHHTVPSFYLASDRQHPGHPRHPPTRQFWHDEVMQKALVVCADIGSVSKGNFGWSTDDGRGGDRPSELAALVVSALDDGLRVALGFECPLFVPLSDDQENLTRGRIGEENRPWSAGAGCGALATGITQTTWILREISRNCVRKIDAYLERGAFEKATNGLLLWEAFVTGTAKSGSHRNDARIACEAYCELEADSESAITIGECISLIGLSGLRAGLSSDVRWLYQPCFVVKARAT